MRTYTPKKACCVQILHVYVYVYVYVYVHVYVCMYVGRYVCMYVMYVCMNVCMYVCMCRYVCIHTYMRMLKTGFHTCELYGRSRIQPFLIPSSLRQSPLDTSPTFGLAELFAELQPPPLLGRRHAAQKHVPRDFDIAHLLHKQIFVRFSLMLQVYSSRPEEMCFGNSAGLF